MRAPGETTPDDYDGPTAAQLFELFDDGVDCVAAVKQTKLDPRTVIVIHQAWSQLRGGIFVAEADLRELCGRYHIGPLVLDGADLVEKLTRQLPFTLCSECHVRERRVCDDCARDMAVSEAQRRAAEEAQRRAQASYEREAANFDIGAPSPPSASPRA